MRKIKTRTLSFPIPFGTPPGSTGKEVGPPPGRLLHRSGF